MRRLPWVLLVLIVGNAALWGQGAPPTEQTELVQSLLARIEKLEKRVAELEGKNGDQTSGHAGDPAQTVDPPQEAAVATPEQERQGGPATAKKAPAGEAHYPSLRFQGFADVDFSATNDHVTPSGFNMGQFVLHLSSPLSKKVSAFGEISFNARPNGFLVELERAFIRYDYNDHFKASFGRFHTPINYWNTTFHHGLWLQTTISRPEMVQFGGRFIPVHFVGMLAEGNIPSGKAGLGYVAGIGNGRGSILSRGGDAGDINNNRAWFVNVFSRPSKPFGLQIGGAVYGDKLTPGGGPEFGELITSGYVVWTKETPEVIAEFANVRHRQLITSQIFNSQAFYVQVAYRLPWDEKHWKPYYRFEYINRPETEPILGVPDLVRSILGVRYDISDYAAFKAEYRHSRREPATSKVDGVFLQTSFTF